MVVKLDSIFLCPDRQHRSKILDIGLGNNNITSARELRNTDLRHECSQVGSKTAITSFRTSGLFSMSRTRLSHGYIADAQPIHARLWIEMNSTRQNRHRLEGTRTAPCSEGTANHLLLPAIGFCSDDTLRPTDTRGS
jgi:hypothetical protein